MLATKTLLRTPRLAVYAYRCNAGPDDKPFPEVHREHSVSFVQRGSFGCRARGQHHELVAGSLLVGYPGDEFMCVHEHHCSGDECLSLHLSAELVAEVRSTRETWRVGSVPPVPELMILGELARAVADGRSHVAFQEVACAVVERFIEVVTGVRQQDAALRARERRRVIDVARWLEANSHTEVDLAMAARAADMSEFHFLRTFARVIGVTPHQYLIRCRLRHAARLLTDAGSSITQIAGAVGFADLSNFIRTFGRAAGMSPLEFRHAAQGKRGSGELLSARFRTLA